MSAKRSNIFNQGRKDTPYNERDDAPVDVPQQATAAVMAQRKIKQGRTIRRAPAVSGAHLPFPGQPQAEDSLEETDPAAPASSQKAWPVVQTPDGRVKLAPVAPSTSAYEAELEAELEAAFGTPSEPDSDLESLFESESESESAYEDVSAPAPDVDANADAQLVAKWTTEMTTAPQPETIQSAEGGQQQPSASFGAPSAQPAFSFGASAPAPIGGNNNSNSFGFSTPSFTQSTGGFGQNTTNSFPPAQASTPSNAFASSSFPAFGGNNANAGSAFNPQPPKSDFNFTASGSNPFGGLSTNGTGTTPSSGSIFSFGASQTQPTGTTGTTTSTAPAVTAPTGSIFKFGGLQAQPVVGSTSTANSAAPAPTAGGIFGQSATPSSNPFSGFNTGTANDSATAPTANIFGVSTAPTDKSHNFFGQSSATSSSGIGGLTAPADSNNAKQGTSNTFGTASTSASTGGLFGSFISPAPNSVDLSNPFSFIQPTQATPASNTFSTGNSVNAMPSNSIFASSMSQAQQDVSRSGPIFSPYPVGSLRHNALLGHLTIPEKKPKPLPYWNMNPNRASALLTPQKIPPGRQYDYLRPRRSGPPSMFESFGRERPRPKTPPPPPSTLVEDAFTAKAWHRLRAQEKEEARLRELFRKRQRERERAQRPLEVTSNQEKRLTENIPAANDASTSSKTPSRPAESSPEILPTTRVEDASTTSSNPKATTPANSNPFMRIARSTSPEKQQAPASSSLKAGTPANSNPFMRIARSASPEKQPALASTPTTPKPTPQAPTHQSPLPQSTSLFTPKAATPITAQPNPLPESKALFSTPMQAPPPIKQQSPSTPAASPGVSSPSLFMSQQPAISKSSNAPNVPNIPKAHVPQQWTESSTNGPSASAKPEDPKQQLAQLSAELTQLNENYKASLLKLTPMGDWSALSKWHYTQSVEITKKIVIAKKRHATALGVTGSESALSTKRKVDEEAHQANESTTPSKKPRSNIASTPSVSSNLFSQTAKTTPPTKDQSQTSGLFGSILSNPDRSASTTPLSKGSEEHNAPQSHSLFKSTSSNSVLPANETSKLKPSAPSTSANNNELPKPGFQVPSFGSSSGGSSFFSQFASHAKTREQLTAERKQKAMPDEFDFDSDDSDEGEDIKARKKEWSAEWDRKESARLEKEKQALQTASGFNATIESNNTTTKSPFTFSKPTENTATSVFSSRVSSPAPSASNSVFNSASAAPSPGPNIFGHLSSGPSSNNHEDSSDDDDNNDGEQSAALQTSEQSPVGGISGSGDSADAGSKRKYGESDNESEETLEETMRRKKQAGTTQKSLFSRTTNSDGSPLTAADINAKIDAENGAAPQSNGLSQTPQNKFNFFDFANAGSKTAPPKPSFAGDQTFKPGNQIKFGTPAADGKSNVPSFSFQPASPTPANSTSKPSSTFSFLNASAGPSAPASVTSSVFSSRAATPASDATDNEQEEEKKAPQLDLSELTEQERADHEILFHTESTIAKHQVDKKWVSCGHGQLWILQRKDSKKAIVRVRSKSGNVDVNYFILPSIPTKVVGGSGKQVSAVRPGYGEGAGVSAIIFALRTPELAQEFSSVYNKNLG